jgi:hypothetical protein
VAAAAEASAPVRLLLVARSSGEWWRQLLPELSVWLDVSETLAIESLEAMPAGRGEAYLDAGQDLSGRLMELPGQQAVDWQAIATTLSKTDLSAPAYGAILTIQPQALVDLLDKAEPPSDDHRVAPQRLQDALLEHEQLYWLQTARSRALVEPGVSARHAPARRGRGHRLRGGRRGRSDLDRQQGAWTRRQDGGRAPRRRSPARRSVSVERIALLGIAPA